MIPIENSESRSRIEFSPNTVADAVSLQLVKRVNESSVQASLKLFVCAGNDILP